jgi:hypothetical protein
VIKALIRHRDLLGPLERELMGTSPSQAGTEVVGHRGTRDTQ